MIGLEWRKNRICKYIDKVVKEKALLSITET